MPVRVALQLPTVRTPEQLSAEFRAAAAARFAAVSIPAAATAVLRAPSLTGALRSSGVEIAAVVESAPMIVSAGVDELRETLEALQPLLATCPTGVVLILPLAAPQTTVRFETCQRAALEILRSIRFDAERRGVRIALSFGRPLDGIAAESVRELIDQANSYWVGCELTAGDAGFGDALATLSHRVAAVRFDRRGAAPETVLASLNAVGLDGVLVLPPGVEAP